MICNYYSRFDQHAGQPVRFAQSRSGEHGEIEVRLPGEIVDSLSDQDKKAITRDGWFRTGKSVLVLPDGTVEVTAREPFSAAFPGRSNSEAVKAILERKCHYISLLSLLGTDGDRQSAILYPHVKSFHHPEYQSTPLDGCFCPRDLHELGKCLGGCLNEANAEIGTRFPKVQTFIVTEEEIH